MRFIVSLVIMFLVSCSCSLHSVQVSGASPTNVTVSDLCKRMSSIKRMPYQDEHVDDDVYNRLIAKGQAVVPCLIDQLTNQTKMPDPRTEPTIADFRVGDLAFFLLLRLTNVPFEQMLPGSVKTKIKEEGVYAYFRYTENPANRVALQQRWQAWLKVQKSKPSDK